MNKFHNGKASAGKGPTPGNKGQNHTKASKDSTANWKTNIGPTGPKRNAVKFKEIKVSVKQHMADDGVPLFTMGDPANGATTTPVPPMMPGLIPPGGIPPSPSLIPPGGMRPSPIMPPPGRGLMPGRRRNSRGLY